MSNAKKIPGFLYPVLREFAQIIVTKKATDQIALDAAHFKERLNFSYSFLSSPMRFLNVVATIWFGVKSVFYYLKPFVQLSSDQKKAYFNKWFHSRSFFNYLLLRPLTALVYTSYYADTEVAKSLGFDDVAEGKPLCHAKREGILDILESDQEMEVEICVIGSGAGGAVVAKELAEKGHEVLILEEGGYFNQQHFQTLSTLERNRYLYREGGFTATLGFPVTLLPTGQCVGGTTVINSGTCYRTPDSILKKWSQEFGLTQLTSQNLDPYFKRVEEILKIQPVSKEAYSQNDFIFQKGVEKLGYRGKPLNRNAEDCKGSGLCIFGCPTGAKQSMEKSYLPLAFKAGAKLYPHCHVDRIDHRTDRVYKIEAYFTDPITNRSRSRLTIYPKKVIVSCGTLNSPLLLKKSRIGLISGQLGKNLTIHPTSKMVGLFDQIIDGHHGVPQGSEMTEFSDEGMMYESVFFPPWLLAASLYQLPEDHYQVMQAYRRLAIYGFLVHDDGNGRVFSGLGGKPVVLYSIGKKETERFIKGLKYLAEILFAAGAKKVYTATRTVHSLDSKKDIENLNGKNIKRKDLESAAFHPLGTCRMGTDVRNSIVNEEMRVHELENLWVADGSIFPTSLGVNPQVTIMSFATRCAEIIDKISNP